MNISNALKALFESPTNAKKELSTSFFGSKRFILIIALVAFVYLTYSVLNLELIKVVANVAIVYIICETVSNLAVTVGNVVLRVHETKQVPVRPVLGAEYGQGGNTQAIAKANP